MKNRPSFWSVPVYAKRVASYPIVVNPTRIQSFKESYQLLNYLEENQHQLSSYEYKLDLFEKNKSSQLAPADFLNSIGIQSQLPEKSFLTIDEHSSWMKDHIILSAERFFGSQNFNLGSGRHANLGSLQYKGIGKNFLSSRLDWSHSNGILPMRDGLMELLVDMKAQRLVPGDMVHVAGLFLFTGPQEDFPLEQKCFLVREGDFIRMEQVPPRLTPEERFYIQTHLEEKLGATSQEQIVNSILTRLGRLLGSGFNLMSPTESNFTIDGRWLDQASVEFSGQGRSDLVVVELSSISSTQVSLNQTFQSHFQTLEENKATFIYSSFELVVLLLTKYADLFRRLQFSSEFDYAYMLKILLSKLSYPNFEILAQKHFFKEKNWYEGMEKISLDTFSGEELQNLGIMPLKLLKINQGQKNIRLVYGRDLLLRGQLHSNLGKLSSVLLREGESPYSSWEKFKEIMT